MLQLVQLLAECSTGGAGAIAGKKTGAKIGSKIGKYPGNLTASAAENAGKAIKVMTMNFDPIASGGKVKNMASDGIKKFMGNKKMIQKRLKKK